MLLQQREDIDAVLAEIDVLERDCRRRLKAEGAPRRRSPTGGGDRGSATAPGRLTFT